MAMYIRAFKDENRERRFMRKSRAWDTAKDWYSHYIRKLIPCIIITSGGTFSIAQSDPEILSIHRYYIRGTIRIIDDVFSLYPGERRGHKLHIRRGS